MPVSLVFHAQKRRTVLTDLFGQLHHPSRLMFAFLLLCISATGASNALAQTLTWTGAGDGVTFGSAANWSPAVSPGPTNDCIIPDGVGTIEPQSTVAIRSLTTGRDLLIDGCVRLTLTNGISLSNNAVIRINNLGTCTSLLFDGGNQSISGNGQILVTNAGSNGSVITLQGSVQLTIGAGVEVSFAPTLSVQRSATYYVDAGCKVTNLGVVSVTTPLAVLYVQGAGTFINSGVLRGFAGSFNLTCLQGDLGQLVVGPSARVNFIGTFTVSQPVSVPNGAMLSLGGTWTASTQIASDGGTLNYSGNWNVTGSTSLTNANWNLSGTYASLGSFTRSGGAITVGGNFSGPQIAASAATGDISLKDLTASGAQFSAADGAKFTIVGTCNFNACSLEALATMDCSLLNVTGGLTFINGAKLSILRGCTGTVLTFAGGTQTIGGNGTIAVENPGGGGAVFKVTQNSSVTLASGVALDFGPFSSSTPSSLTIESGSALNAFGPISVRASAWLTIDGAGSFGNYGSINAAPGTRLNVLPANWTNGGTITGDNANLSFAGNFPGFGTLSRTGGSLYVSGTTSGATLEASAATGDIVLLNFSAINSSLLAAPAQSFLASGTVNLDACTIGGSFAFAQCGDVGITGGLHLQNGNIMVGATGSCTSYDGFVFSGGSQQLSGTGSIGIAPGTTVSKIMRLRDGVDLTVGAGITIGPGAAVRQATITIDAGCTLRNSGTIAATGPGQSVVLTGAGMFVNDSLVDAGAGTASVLTSSWLNNGIFRVAPSGVLNLGGAYSTLGTIDRSGGSIALAGTFSGTALHASAATGDITLNGVALTGVTLTSADGARFRTSGEVTLDGCTLATALTISCANVTVRNGLTFSSNAGVNVGDPACVGSLTFSGSQTVQGTGEFALFAGTDSTLIRIGDNAVVAFDSGITVRWSGDTTPISSVPTGKISIGDNATLVNRGTIAVRQSNRNLSFTGVSTATLLNEGTLETTSGTLRIADVAWTNSGTLALSGSATLNLGGSYSAFGTLIRTGGTLMLSGTYSGASLIVGAATGDVVLRVAKLSGTTIAVEPGYQLTTSFSVELSNCTIASNLDIDVCTTFTISGGLVLNGTVLNFGAQKNCSVNGAFLEFGAAAQTISGTGELRLNGALVNVRGQTTFGPGILMQSGPLATSPATTITVSSGAALVNQGTILGNTNSLLKIAGPFVNQGVVSALSGSLELTALSGSAGLLSVSPTSSLTISGTFSLDNPIDIGSGRSLSLSGNWTNNTQITTTGGTVSLLGTWINNGAFILTGSSVTVGGSYTSLGNFTTSSSQLTYTGTIPVSTLTANSSTGDITLKAATLNNVLLQSSDGAKFRVIGTTSSKFNGCTVAADIVVVDCSTATISNGLTFVGGAEIQIKNLSESCSSYGVELLGSPQTITGNGAIRMLASPTGSAIAVFSQATFDTGVSFVIDSQSSTGYAAISIPASMSLTNKGVLSADQLGAQLAIVGGGPFLNQGLLRAAPWASISIVNLSGPLGLVSLDVGAALILAGNYSISDPLTISGGGGLNLSGTWTNNSTISVDHSTLVLGGTWTNAGTLAVSNSAWTIGGTYTTLGNTTGSSNALTYAGTFPGPVLEANASTGDITLSTLTLNNTTLRTRDNARINIGLGSAVTMSQCRIETDLRFTFCSTLSINKGLTLADGTTLTLDNPFCNRPALTFTGTTQSVTGRAKLAILDAGSANAITLSTSTNSVVTLGPEVELAFGPTPAGSAAPLSNFTISVGSGRTLLNQGLIASRLAGKTLTISTGTFQNNGTVESAAGSINITSTLSNYLANVSRLTGGRWIMSGGSLTFGTSVINSIGPGTEFRIQSAAGTSPSFASFGENLGTFAIASRTLAITPAGGTFSNAGTLELGPAATMQVNGALAFDPASTLRIPMAALAQPALGKLTATGPITLAGKLAAAFTPPFTPLSGDTTAAILSSPSILGAFASTCADGNSASLGVQPLLDSVSAPNTLALLVTDSGGLTPFITQQPADTSAAPNATFSCAASPADSTFRWFKDGVALVDGPTGHGSVINGALSASLTVAGATSSDSGLYTCSATNSCGTTLSNPARLSVCSGDFNADGLVDDSDFQLFVASYNLLDCADPAMPPDCPADLDRSGAVDDGDFPIFILSYDTLLCP